MIQQPRDIESVWNKRIELSRTSFNTYYKILTIRLFKYPIQTMMPKAIKMLKLALTSNNWVVFDDLYSRLFEHIESNPDVIFLKIKSEWQRGNKSSAMDNLKRIIMSEDLNDVQYSKFSFQYGQWILNSQFSDSFLASTEEALPYIRNSISKTPGYYKAWHRFGWVLSYLYSQSKQMLDYASNAIRSFLKCIEIKGLSALSDLIQLIFLFFCADFDDETFEEIGDKISKLPDQVLIFAAPQIFAQLSRDGTRSCSYCASILRSLLTDHYHILLYHLMLLTRDKAIAEFGMIKKHFNESLNEASAKPINKTALSLLSSYSMVASDEASQAQLISSELLMCSTSLLEYWYELLLSLERQTQSNFDEIMKVAIKSLHNPRSINDKEFISNYREAIESINTPSKCSEITARMKKHLMSTSFIDMNKIAPELACYEGFKLAVPGTYKIGHELITISSFDPLIEIYHSKQRPRLVIIRGDNGLSYRSLLKGGEDLRMDQRMMQFFELINQHINSKLFNDVSKQRINTYCITPLSKTAGLIEFVDGTDTFFTLINDYRKRHGRLHSEESTMMEELSVKPIDKLQPIQRLELIQEVINLTPDTDLRESIWQHSQNSRIWVLKTHAFTESCAIMSIIGYIIGLGDRHPSNLMMNRATGAVVHIDFGDCFDVSRKRVLFPELIPFRLTRMMVSAFGVNGVEGDFRLTSHDILGIVRAHKESIMAVLDVFLQEPLEYGGNTSADDSFSINNSIHYKKVIQNSLHDVYKKITGNDDKVGIEEQVDGLIRSSQDLYNLSKVYHGWTPLW